MLFQQITGQPSVLYYAASIFREAGFVSAGAATGVALVLGAFKLVMTVGAVCSVDSWGRRPLLLWGVGGIVAALGILWSIAGGVLALPPRVLAWCSLGALLLYVGAYQMSFGPISWLMVGEVFPLRVRSQAIALATLINFSANFAVSLMFPAMQKGIGIAGAAVGWLLVVVGRRGTGMAEWWGSCQAQRLSQPSHLLGPRTTRNDPIHALPAPSLSIPLPATYGCFTVIGIVALGVIFAIGACSAEWVLACVCGRGMPTKCGVGMGGMGLPACVGKSRSSSSLQPPSVIPSFVSLPSPPSPPAHHPPATTPPHRAVQSQKPRASHWRRSRPSGRRAVMRGGATPYRWMGLGRRTTAHTAQPDHGHRSVLAADDPDA